MAAFDLTPEAEAAFWNELKQHDQKRTQYRRQAAANPAIATNLVIAHNAAPSSPPGVKLSAAQAAAAGLLTQQQMVDAVMAGMKQNLTGALDAVKASKSKPFLQRLGDDPFGVGILNPIKAATRTSLGALQSGAQLVQTFGAQEARNLTGATDPSSLAHASQSASYAPNNLPGNPGLTPANILRSTTLGQQVTDLATRGTTDQGSGWFPSGASEVYRKEAERNVRGVIPGTDQTATIGRVLASSVVEPGSGAYRVLSGVADAAVAWYADPANIALSELKVAREGRNLFAVAKTLSDADMAKVLRPGERVVADAVHGQGVWRNVLNKPEFVPYATLADEARTIRRAEAGVIDAHRGTVAPRKPEEWGQSTKGRAIFQSIADDSNFRSIHKALGGQVPPEIIARLEDAKTPEAVAEVVYEVLGTSVRSTTDISKVKAPNWWQQTRLAQAMPKARLGTGWRTAAAERIDAVNNLDAYMSNALKIDPEVQAKILSKFGRGLTGNSQDRYQALAEAMNAVEDALVASNVERTYAHSLTHFTGDADTISKFGVDRIGRDDDFGYLEAVKALGYKIGDSSQTLKAIGPMLFSEGLSDSAYLPNIREIRRLTGSMGWLTSGRTHWYGGTKTGQLRVPLAMLEHVQNGLIKPLAIIRPAFLLRVIGEEQFRMAANGQASIVRHPLEWIQYAMHNSGSFDALGRDFAALEHHARDWKKWDEFSASLHRGVMGRGAKHLVDPLAAERVSYRTGDVNTVSKVNYPQQWEQGHIDEVRQLSNDPAASRIAGGQTNDQITNWLHSKDVEGQRAFEEIKTLLANKASRTNEGKWVKAYADATDDNVLHAYLDSTRARISEKVGNNEELLGAIAHGTLGHDEVTMTNHELRRVIEPGPHAPMDPFDPASQSSTWIGSKVKLKDGRVGTIVNNADEPGKSIVQLAAGAWDHEGTASAQMRAATKAWRENPASPDTVKYFTRTAQRLDGKTEASRISVDAFNMAVNGFFSGAYGRSSDYLSRSPSFRQFYWQRVTELAQNLAPDEANKFLRTLEEAAARHEGGSVSALLGGDKAVDRAIDAAKNANGTLTHTQLDDYARGWALDQTKDLLYDASKRGQLFDIARVIFPFGEAWKEVTFAWGKAIAHNPRLVRRAQLLVQGGRDLDPDGNGQGFFHVDPATGNEVFSMPFAPEVSRALTGMAGPVPISQEMNISLKSLNIGMTMMPSIGWVATAAVGALVPDKPAFDDVRNFLMPYGNKGVTTSAIVPSWATKIAGGLTDNPNSTRIYGDTYMRTVQYLVASGKYGSSFDEQERLKKDAVQQARVLTIIRGLQQAVGPAAPSVDFQVATEQGDKMASALTKEYAALVQENPQTALESFQRIYGATATAYAVSRTRSVNGGLDDSKQFGDWERAHGKVFSQAPDVAGYFGPIGSDFDFAVYERQLHSGKRDKLSADAYLSAVNEVIGNAKYYDLRDQVNASNAAVGRKSPTTEQRAWLKRQRESILAQYPVPNPTANDRAPLPDQIRQLGDVIDSKGLQGNPVADATRQYLTLRDQAMAEATRNGHTLAASDAQPLREWLARKGAALAAQTPEFARLWDRVLSREVEVP